MNCPYLQQKSDVLRRVYNKSKRIVREVALFCRIASSVAEVAPTNGCPLYNEVRQYDFRSSCAPRPHRGRIHECPASSPRLVAAAAERPGRPRASSAAGADFTKQGDIEFWHGKDTSGNFPKLIKQFNDSAPQRQGHLPRAARHRGPAAPADDPEHPDQEPEDGAC